MKRLIGVLFVCSILIVAMNESVAQTMQAGISNSGTTLTVKAKTSSNVTTGSLSNVVVTIQYPTAYGITFGTLTDGAMTTGQAFGFTKQTIYTSGANSYLTVIAVPGAGSITWNADGTEYLLFSVPISGGTGTGTFTLIKDAATASNNGDPYFELGGSDVTNNTTPFYTASVSGVPLPVELTSFTAISKGRNVELAWKTATETNNAGFEIERKHAGQDWTKISFVEGHGTSAKENNYSYKDVVKSAAQYQYRLKQIDRDGKFTYGAAVEVTTTLSAEDYKMSANYPNPFNPSTKFTFAVKNDEQVAVKVFNMLGQEVATLFNGIAAANTIHEMNFNASALASGTYFYMLKTKDRYEIKKMMLMK